jgi:hypothetical protein
MTQLQVINLAMNHLGLSELANLTDDDPKVDCANTFWEPCRDDVLRRGWWTFATAQKTLTDITDDDNLITGWDYSYTMPTSVMNVQAIYDEQTVNSKYLQDFEEQYSITMNTTVLLTNLSDAIADVTFKVTDVSKWTPDFNMAFSYQLASMMAHQLTGDPNIGLKMAEIANMYINETKRISHTQKKKDPAQKKGYIESRA